MISNFAQIFLHRVVLEENGTVLVVDVDETGDHDEDEEAKDRDDDNLKRQFVRKYSNVISTEPV